MLPDLESICTKAQNLLVTSLTFHCVLAIRYRYLASAPAQENHVRWVINGHASYLVGQANLFPLPGYKHVAWSVLHTKVQHGKTCFSYEDWILGPIMLR